MCAFHKDALFSLNVILTITYIFQKYTENTLGNVLECTGFIYLFIIHCLFYLLLLSIFFFFFLNERIVVWNIIGNTFSNNNL